VLAGIAGATVSRLEEINEGLTIFTMVSLVGVYIGLGAANTLIGAGTNAFVVFAFLFPLSSPFVLPGAILVGNASLPIVALAIALELVLIILLFRFVAKIYETLILHNGNTIKLKQLFQISKSV
jgi:ABC-2 type transport system permease protein